jgi:hypothetical protein
MLTAAKEPGRPFHLKDGERLLVTVTAHGQFHLHDGVTVVDLLPALYDFANLCMEPGWKKEFPHCPTCKQPQVNHAAFFESPSEPGRWISKCANGHQW